MSLFVDIVSRITLPLVLLMGLGYVLERKLKLDVVTLSKLLVYAVLPCALIHFLTSARLPLSAVGVSAWFAAAQFFALLGLGWLVARLMRLAAGRTRRLRARRRLPEFRQLRPASG